jgi:hypothetical protein
MNFLKIAFLSVFLAICSFATAVPAPTSKFFDYEFQQEKMILTSNSVIAISSFDSEDHISAYSYQGDRLWDKTFHAKILSWQIVSDYVFVFSKHRDGHKTYITCLDRYNGSLIWQRP